MSVSGESFSTLQADGEDMTFQEEVDSAIRSGRNVAIRHPFNLNVYDLVETLGRRVYHSTTEIA